MNQRHRLDGKECGVSVNSVPVFNNRSRKNKKTVVRNEPQCREAHKGGVSASLLVAASPRPYNLLISTISSSIRANRLFAFSCRSDLIRISSRSSASQSFGLASSIRPVFDHLILFSSIFILLSSIISDGQILCSPWVFLC